MKPPSNNLCRILLIVALFGICGVALAGQPPSPARDLSIESLLALKKPEHEHYYILIFGSQRASRMPRYTHSWATMVKTTEVPGSPTQITDVQTISWLPATLNIRVYRLQVETGVNIDLCTTIAEMLRHKETVSLWGPFETWQGFYTRFATQKAFLESGALGYQCNDEFGEAARRCNGCNCFHALSDMDPQFDRRQYPLLDYGDRASENIVRQLFARPILIHPHQTHDWLIPALRIDQCPIVRRQYVGCAKEFSPEAVLQELANPTTPRRLGHP
jgi:hypothetical protein